MNVFLRFKPNALGLRLSLSHMPCLGFLSSPPGAEETDCLLLKGLFLGEPMEEVIGIY